VKVLTELSLSLVIVGCITALEGNVSTVCEISIGGQQERHL